MYRAVCHEYLSFIDLYNCNSAFFNDLRLDCSQACEVCCIRKCLQKLFSLVFIKKTSSNQNIPIHQNDINVVFMCNEGKQINQSLVAVIFSQKRYVH